MLTSLSNPTSPRRKLPSLGSAFLPPPGQLFSLLFNSYAPSLVQPLLTQALLPFPINRRYRPPALRPYPLPSQNTRRLPHPPLSRLCVPPSPPHVSQNYQTLTLHLTRKQSQSLRHFARLSAKPRKPSLRYTPSSILIQMQRAKQKTIKRKSTSSSCMFRFRGRCI